MDADLFNNAVALLSVMVLTKVADRHRREAKNAEFTDRRNAIHQCFVAVSLAGIVLAMAGSAIVDCRSPASWLVGILLAVSGALFASELMRRDRKQQSE